MVMIMMTMDQHDHDHNLDDVVLTIATLVDCCLLLAVVTANNCLVVDVE